MTDKPDKPDKPQCSARVYDNRRPRSCQRTATVTREETDYRKTRTFNEATSHWDVQTDRVPVQRAYCPLHDPAAKARRHEKMDTARRAQAQQEEERTARIRAETQARLLVLKTTTGIEAEEETWSRYYTGRIVLTGAAVDLLLKKLGSAAGEAAPIDAAAIH